MVNEGPAPESPSQGSWPKRYSASSKSLHARPRQIPEKSTLARDTLADNTGELLLPGAGPQALSNVISVEQAHHTRSQKPRPPLIELHGNECRNEDHRD